MSDIEPGKHFVITLIKGEDESPRDYVSRCNAIAAFARERSSTETPTAVTSLDHFTQVSETAYEIVTPGYQSKEETGNERDTHFAGSASSLWLAIRAELRNFLYDEALDARGEETEIAIQRIIAHHDYDLVFQHALVYLREGADIPDMTEWPEQSE